MNEFSRESPEYGMGTVSPLRLYAGNCSIVVSSTLDPFSCSAGFEAGMDWILHLDTDELIYPAGAHRAMYSLAQSRVKNKPELWQSSAKKSKYDEKG
ncbi:unnamed protein product [Eruca vesicaria subsp. sativa]|uniref:Glycosyltransferase family 92 protein n=1 Tax=Eruca vesicaria subsp. sativa TaxID=29727 RepID=A0ABC8KB02_ERUVS|nr:unnamed protein product [Eruca vesicaria subsp. sativa]